MSRNLPKALRYFSVFNSSSACSAGSPVKYASKICSTRSLDTSDWMRCTFDDEARDSYVGTSRRSCSLVSSFALSVSAVDVSDSPQVVHLFQHDIKE